MVEDKAEGYGLSVLIKNEETGRSEATQWRSNQTAIDERRSASSGIRQRCDTTLVVVAGDGVASDLGSKSPTHFTPEGK